MLLAIEKTEGCDRLSARIIVLVCAICYGSNYLCLRILGDTIYPSVVAVLRFSIAALIFLPSFMKGLFRRPQLILWGLEVGLYNAVGSWMQSNALVAESTSTVAFISSLSIIVVPFLEGAFSDLKKGKNEVYLSMLSSLLATGGIAILELGGNSHLQLVQFGHSVNPYSLE